MKEHPRRRDRGRPLGNTSAGKGIAWKATLRAFLLLLVLATLAGAAIVYSIARRGLSAHTRPTRAEEIVARAMRSWATPAAVRDRANPVQATPDTVEEAMAHYADHCATCHANNGSGDTAIGRGLYPRVPDMRQQATQSLTDGELFSIIEHGIRLTGMPAWGNGTPEGERESWALVHFIRRLPTLSDDDISRMEALNPKTREQWQEDEEARRFLAGDDAKPTPKAPHTHDGRKN
jgi:mono/diheme cytochrome c family protein